MTSRALVACLALQLRLAGADTTCEASTEREAAGESTSLLQLPGRGATLAEENRTEDDAFLCPKNTDCASCMYHNIRCRWCPTDMKCHNKGSLENPCKVPINSANQCWEEKCPFQVGDFLEDRADDLVQWTSQFAETITLPLMPFPVYQSGTTGIVDLATGEALADAKAGGAATGIRVTGASDWGTGTCVAKTGSALMGLSKPHHTIHLGDVYYVGTEDQFDTSVLGKAPNDHQVGVSWPKGSVSTFLMNGNHEMISGGAGLMKTGFSYTSQETTYKVYQSDRWRVLVLDTSYDCMKFFPDGSRRLWDETDAPMRPEVVAWLNDTVHLGDASDKRGLIVMTHHQPYSSFEGQFLGTAKQLDELLPEGRTLVWFCGHNHRLAFYHPVHLSDGGWTSKFVQHMRMVGNGMPDQLETPKTAAGLFAHDGRLFQKIPRDVVPIPQEIGYNGFFTLDFDGPKVTASYITTKCVDGTDTGDCQGGLHQSESTQVLRENFVVDASGHIKQTLEHIAPDLTCACGGKFSGCAGECLDAAKSDGSAPTTVPPLNAGLAHQGLIAALRAHMD